MAESVMLNRAKDFTVETVNACRDIQAEKREYVLTGQLMRCGTSIGANIHESKYAQSPADFVSKMQIALKECYETEYWPELLNRTAFISDGAIHLPAQCLRYSPAHARRLRQNLQKQALTLPLALRQRRRI